MELPLFPLHVVLFPGRPLPLHLFEPRYRQLLSDCLDGDSCFGVVAIRSGREVGGQADIFEIGTVAEIESCQELADERYDITTRGTRRFRVERLLDAETPYLTAEVTLLEDAQHSTDGALEAHQLRELLVPYLADLGAPQEVLERIPTEPADLAHLAAAALQVEMPTQQRLLELDSVAARVSQVLAMLRRETGLARHFGTVGSLSPQSPGGARLN
jgi:Lon protease-like protein